MTATPSPPTTRTMMLTSRITAPTQSPSQSYEDGDASYDADVEDDVSDTELLPTAYGIFCNEHRFIGFDKHDDEPEPEPLPEWYDKLGPNGRALTPLQRHPLPQVC